jgi:hypothetical protein
MYFVYILVCLQSGRSYVAIRMIWYGVLDPRERRGKANWERLPTRSLAAQRERYYKSGSGNRAKHGIVEIALREFWPEGSVG